MNRTNNNNYCYYNARSCSKTTTATNAEHTRKTYQVNFEDGFTQHLFEYFRHLSTPQLVSLWCLWQFYYWALEEIPASRRLQACCQQETTTLAFGRLHATLRQTATTCGMWKYTYAHAHTHTHRRKVTMRKQRRVRRLTCQYEVYVTPVIKKPTP